MKASTLFALAIALLVGLAAAAGAKYAGFFDKAAPPPPQVTKPTPTKALVSRTNLFEELATTSAQVGVRDLTPEEEKSLQERFGKTWKDKLMPALPSAVHLLFPKQSITADQVLLKDHFADPHLPEDLSRRLEPNTRAVNVSLPKDKAAGGALRVGEYVDVLMTTKVGVGAKEELKTACIARDCKIVMKRNSIWSVMGSDPDNKPLNFTLQANAYRAALIDYAQTRGQISIQPVPAPTKTANGSFSDPNSTEYALEDERVEKMRQGALVIGDEDLARVFMLPGPKPKAKPVVVTPQPTPPPTPRTPPVVISHLAGLADAGRSVFYGPDWANALGNRNGDGGAESGPRPRYTSGAALAAGAYGDQGLGGPAPAAPAPAPVAAPVPPPEEEEPVYTFKLPSSTGKQCKACEEKKKKQAAMSGQ